jgi:hypothetical protein
MIQITKVQSVEREKREDLGMTVGNPFFMAFENTQRELICVWSCRFLSETCDKQNATRCAEDIP